LGAVLPTLGKRQISELTGQKDVRLAVNVRFANFLKNSDTWQLEFHLQIFSKAIVITTHFSASEGHGGVR
jgi:hypothetical protein